MLTLWNGFERNFSRALAEHNHLLQQYQPASLQWGWPRVEVVETADKFEVQAEVPGFVSDDLTITLHDGVLTIAGEHTSEQQPNTKEDRTVLFSERRALSFTRTFRLSQDIDAEAVTANVKDGVLTVTMPKVEAAKPRLVTVTTE
ncbi:MAG TPA: Hsp20/alpha crystallin family protein [Sorangium sp.]|nr:Hsp20/alpha crystallin family protein [Sorangium sp.]